MTDGWATGLSTITLFAEDYEATKRFYDTVFGLPVVFEDAHSAVFRFGGIQVNLLTATQAHELIEPASVAPPEAGARMQLTITVDDVDALCARLHAQGVEFLNGPIDRPWGVRTAAFQDPAGHVWEIAH